MRRDDAGPTSLLKPAGKETPFTHKTTYTPTMKRFLLTLLALSLFAPISRAADKLKDVVVKPGETVYIRFDVQSKKLRLAAVSREADPATQVIFTLAKDETKPLLKLKIENKLSADLKFRAEIRSKTLRLRTPLQIVPVVAGKVGYETMPSAVEELAAFDFAYARYTPAPETPKG